MSQARPVAPARVLFGRFFGGLLLSLSLLFMTVQPSVAFPEVAPSADALRPVLPDRVGPAIARIYPALVQINVVQVNYRGGRAVKSRTLGSGVVFTDQGHVITNHHVAGHASRVRVRLADRSELSARLVGTDALSDIAVLQVDLSGRREPLPHAEFGDSDRLRVGDPVLAMGCPVGLSQSVTRGIISNTGFVIPDIFWPLTFTLDGEEVGSVVKWIGHDAPISPGNSGGPLVDLDGRIVGINEISMGLSGAIPGNLARDVAAALVREGAVRRGWFGFTCQPLLRGGGASEGAMVADVSAGSPAARAGIRAGDTLLSLDGRPVNVAYPEDLQQFNLLVAGVVPGRTVVADIRRGRETLHLRMVAELRTGAQGEEREFALWGMTARNLTPYVARELRLAGTNGVHITSLRPGGCAVSARPSLQEQDVIVSVNGKPVRDVQSLGPLTASLVGAGSATVPVLVEFLRSQERMACVVRLGTPPRAARPAESRKAWLPVSYQVLTSDLAQAFGLPRATMGVVLTNIPPRSPAETAGLRAGDVLTHVDNQSIQSSQVEEAEIFPYMIRQYPVDSTVVLTVLRGRPAARLSISLKLAARPTEEGQMASYSDPDFEFEARDVGYLDRVRERWEPSQKGALVQTVAPGGWAGIAHLAVGDLILAVDGIPIGSVQDLEKTLRSLAQQKPKQTAFFVRRGIHTLFVEIAPSWSAVRGAAEGVQPVPTSIPRSR